MSLILTKLRLLVAPDSFKGTMTAVEIGEIFQAELSPELTVIAHPLADGGEGTLEAIAASLTSYQWRELNVTGPLPGSVVRAKYLWLPDRATAFIEMAQASGLTLLRPDQYNPELTTTYGTGELIAHAIDRGAKQLYLTLGGSATNDAGLGLLMALGWSFLDAQGQSIGYGGQGLIKLAQIVPPQHLFLPPVTILSDVTNPLYGENGAAYVYAPQKGATPGVVEKLDQGLRHLAAVVKQQQGIDLNFAGAGAAGGLGAGAQWGLQAHLTSGFQAIAAFTHLESQIQQCDWVLTGEGQLDAQSLQGKVISGVREIAQKYQKPLILLCGSVDLELLDPNIHVFTLVGPDFSRYQCLSAPQLVLRHRCQRIKQFLLSQRRKC
jgi:glycerate kinase